MKRLLSSFRIERGRIEILANWYLPRFVKRSYHAGQAYMLDLSKVPSFFEEGREEKRILEENIS